ncbi:MAG TPA: hypothetical protein VMR25_11160 [Planctomycetaceae bacterium]|jgi:hypothetical protein|nr:hypothetical protein [Planctomycetaceae bacterium]
MIAIKLFANSLCEMRPVRKRTLVSAAIALLWASTIVVAAAPDVYAPRPADEVRGQLMRWLTQHGFHNEKTAPRIAAIWAAGGGPAPGREVFDRLIQSFCVADPDTRHFVEAASPGQPLKAFPTQDFLNRDESDEFYTIHLRLFYARALTQRLMYDEALALFARIDPARVVDPATCLFYEAVCQHQLLKKTEGLGTLDKLLHRTEGVAESYARVAALMQDELQSLDDQSLDAVSRKMQDSQRRLDLGRGGQRVQKVQEEIIESLSEIIKKNEQQANQQAQSGQGENNSNRSAGPAEDSRIKGATAPGNVDKKDLKKQGAWGNLQDKQIREAKNLLNRDFPSNYHDAVEQYFKKLADHPASK